MPARWKSLLSGALRARAIESIADIARDLRPFARVIARGEEPIDPTLAGGIAGIALFFAYLDRAGLSDSADAIARDLIQTAVEAVERIDVPFGFLSGLTGVAWAAEHTRATLFEASDEDPLTEIDDAVLNILNAGLDWQYKHDIFDGLVGIGNYSMQRPPSDASRTALVQVVRHLNAAAQRDAHGACWMREGRELEPPHERWTIAEPYVPLGVARGQAGVIAFLAKVVRLERSGSEARDLLRDAVKYFLSCRETEESESLFPLAVVGSRHIGPSHLSWCYGDLGACLAICHAARALDDVPLFEEARTIARSIALRPPRLEDSIDACLCHGTAGAGHILNRMSDEFGDRDLRLAAQEWFKLTLRLNAHRTGIGGYLFNWQGASRPLPGFVRGSSGVGLALLAAVSTVEPNWDRALLIS